MVDIQTLVQNLESGEHIHIQNPENVNLMLQEMEKDGRDNLQVIADFDMTLSKYSNNGIRCDTSHGIIEESPFLDQSFQDMARSCKVYYQSIEFNPNISQEDKLPLMIEWWTKTHNLLVSQKKITREMVRMMALRSNCILRDGCDWLFDVLNKYHVPLLVFSAGVGDLIEQIIERYHPLTDNMKIVSNFMRFDDTGFLIGFQEKIIHALNKNELILADTQYFDNLKSRHNIILLGDSLGDLHMADGARDAKHILKIGFLNRNVKDSLPIYKREYDIVIVEDNTLDLVNAILKTIMSS